MASLLADVQLDATYEIIAESTLDATDFLWDRGERQEMLTHLPTGCVFCVLLQRDRFRYRIVYTPGPVSVTSHVRSAGPWSHVLRHMGKWLRNIAQLNLSRGLRACAARDILPG